MPFTTAQLLQQITTAGLTSSGLFACFPGGCTNCLFIGDDITSTCYLTTAGVDDERSVIAQLRTNNPEYFL